MTKLTVVSIELRSVGYDAANNLLEVEFVNGSVYRYGGVPVHEYSNLISALSKGRYFNQEIRNKYGSVRVGSAPA